jgi:AcrR family transcriptional regulator
MATIHHPAPRARKPGATPPPGRQRRPTAGTDDKRERILQVAQALFHEHGYAQTTMAMVVAALGVSKPYVYYYFKDKQQIFEWLAWRASVACLTVFDGSPDDARPAHRQVSEGVQALIERTVQNHPAAFFAFREPQAFRPEMQAALRKLSRHFQARLSALLEQARREGQLDFDDASLAARAVCSLPGFMFSWYRPDGRLPQAEVVRQLTRLALKMVMGARTR